MSVDFLSAAGAGEAKDYDFSEAGIVEIRREEKEPSFEESERFQTLNFSDRIQKLEEGIFTTTVIDRAICVRTLSQEIIREKIGFWEQRKVTAIRYALCAAVVTVVAGFFAWKGLPWVGFLSGGGALIASYQIYQYSQAQGQIEKWSRDIVKEIADQRLLAFKKGLIHIYKEDVARPLVPMNSRRSSAKMSSKGSIGNISTPL